MKKCALLFAWIISCVALIGSLYFGEGLEPCLFCWYQRIVMFFLVILLGCATWKKYYKILPYTIVLSIIGLLLALFQIFGQEIPELISLCGGPACEKRQAEIMGSLPLPVFSAIAFFLITVLLFWSYFSYKKSNLS